jgi:chromate reductase
MNKNLSIAIIAASEIKNLELAKVFESIVQKVGAEAQVINLVELDLPLYSSRTEMKFKGEELLSSQIQILEKATGLIFISPEYNGSTPPVFNNFLAWLSRSSKDWRFFLNGKPAAIATFSGGGGLNVLLAMRTQLSFIGMNVLGRQVLTSPHKAPDENTLTGIVTDLLRYSRT